MLSAVSLVITTATSKSSWLHNESNKQVHERDLERQILEGTYSRQDISQNGHILAWTYPGKDKSQNRTVISQNGPILGCKIFQNNICILQWTYPRTEKFWKIRKPIVSLGICKKIIVSAYLNKCQNTCLLFLHSNIF